MYLQVVQKVADKQCKITDLTFLYLVTQCYWTTSNWISFSSYLNVVDFKNTVRKCDCQNVSVVCFCGHLEKPDKEFLEVKNQKAKSDSFPYNFTVCLSTMFDFTNELQVTLILQVSSFLNLLKAKLSKVSLPRQAEMWNAGEQNGTD